MKKGPFSQDKVISTPKSGAVKAQWLGVFFFGFGSLDPKDQLDSYFQSLIQHVAFSGTIPGRFFLSNSET